MNWIEVEDALGDSHLINTQSVARVCQHPEDPEKAVIYMHSEASFITRLSYSRLRKLLLIGQS